MRGAKNSPIALNEKQKKTVRDEMAMEEVIKLVKAYGEEELTENEKTWMTKRKQRRIV